MESYLDLKKVEPKFVLFIFVFRVDTLGEAQDGEVTPFDQFAIFAVVIIIIIILIITVAVSHTASTSTTFGSSPLRMNSGGGRLGIAWDNGPQMDSRRNMLLILERRNYGQEATGSYLKAIDSYLQPTAAINNDPHQ
eukprot:scaffold35328_cov150-Skeletonema_dohrnii-CCMP3373.AAC.1